MIPPYPRAVLFDWDSTLVDNWEAVRCSINAARCKFGMPPWSREETIANAARSQRDAFPRLFGENWRDARTLFYETFEREHLTGLALMPGAAALLDTLAQRGIPLGVVSNKHGAFLRREAEALGWTDRFAALVGAQDAARDKPFADPVWLALDRMGIARIPIDTIWLVGDSETDLAAAAAVGCSAILVETNPAPPTVQPEMRVARCVDCHAVSELLGRIARPI